MKKLRYPFRPRSTLSLIPGQFWSIPLRDGSYACGRVIEIAPKGRTSFLAGLMDWHGVQPPDSDSLAGVACLEQGDVHLKAIWENGEMILGLRDLGLDAIEPWLFRGAFVPTNSYVRRGYTLLRPQTAADHNLPLMGTWGYSVIKIAAEKRFLRI